MTIEHNDLTAQTEDRAAYNVQREFNAAPANTAPSMQLHTVETDMAQRFKVWIDGDAEKNSVETDFGIIEAEDMNAALDKAAQMAGYIDHADIAQALGWEESEFNIVAAGEEE